MATKNQKIIGLILGAVMGGVIANRKAIKNKKTDSERLNKVMYGGIIGSLSGYGLSVLFGSSNDTVNYQLLRGKKGVYHGITYKERFETRKLEHIKTGKKFTSFTVGKAIPRVDALQLEKQLIIKDKPVYNIQHNKK
jgi:hypothetical protein